MNLFETVKAAVPIRQAAKMYGLHVNQNGMTCCPFHNDRHPSLKLNTDYFYCFGCGAQGDVTELTARLFGLSPTEAAHKLCADFGLSTDKNSVIVKLKAYSDQVEKERLCFRVLNEYLRTLKDWKKRYAPKSPDDALHPKFTEACHMLDSMQYMVELLSTAPKKERAALVEDLIKDDKISLLQERLKEIKEERNEPNKY